MSLHECKPSERTHKPHGAEFTDFTQTLPPHGDGT